MKLANIIVKNISQLVSKEKTALKIENNWKNGIIKTYKWFERDQTLISKI